MQFYNSQTGVVRDHSIFLLRISTDTDISPSANRIKPKSA